MKTKEYSISFFLFLIISIGWAQNRQKILKVSEDVNGNVKVVKNIVDINGNLEVKISKEELLKRIQNDYPSFGEQIELKNRINLLNKALENQEKIYTVLEKNIRTAAEDKSLNGDILDLMGAIEGTDLENKYDNLYYEWDKLYGADENPKVSQEFYILEDFNTYCKSLSKTLSNHQGQSFFISLLAFIKNKQGGDRVHIENFDTYSEREFYKVPRWVTNISPEQKKELEAIAKKANTLNESAVNFFDSLKSGIENYIPNLECASSLKDDIKTFLDDPNVESNITDALTKDIEVLQKKYNEIFDLLSITKEDISNWSITRPFEIIEEVKNLKDLVDDIPTFISGFKNTGVAITDIKNEVSALVGKLDNCKEEIQLGVESIIKLMETLKLEQTRYIANETIGEEVYKFSFDNLPNTGYINLEGSGKRDNGDGLELQLVITPKSGDDKVDDQKKRILEKRALTMQLIGLRSETVVGILMADSFNENNFTPIEDKRFLYAPSAALLLKVGSRNSKLYNNFIDFGLGIAISTPDFDTDGSPEFGAGLILTAFKDILSVGINYNVTLDTPYWSFGINLPFNLPGIPINKVD